MFFKYTVTICWAFNLVPISTHAISKDQRITQTKLKQILWQLDFVQLCCWTSGIMSRKFISWYGCGKIHQGRSAVGKNLSLQLKAISRYKKSFVLFLWCFRKIVQGCIKLSSWVTLWVVILPWGRRRDLLEVEALDQGRGRNFWGLAERRSAENLETMTKLEDRKPFAWNLQIKKRF